MDQNKLVILKNTCQYARMVHEEIHGQLVDGDSIIVGKEQEAIVLHDDGHIATVFKPGTFVLRSDDEWDHKGRLFFVNYAVTAETEWRAILYLVNRKEQLVAEGKLHYRPSDAKLFTESMAARHILDFTAFEAEKRLVKQILQGSLPAIIKNAWENTETNKSMSVSSEGYREITKQGLNELNDIIMPSLSMYFLAGGLLLVDCVITLVKQYDESVDESDSVTVGNITPICGDSENSTGSVTSWDNIAGNWQNGGWSDNDWSNNYSSWSDSSWSNSSYSGNCSDGGNTVEEQTTNITSETEAMFRAAIPKGIAPGGSFPLVIAMFSSEYQQDAEAVIHMVSEVRTEAQTGLFEVPKRNKVSIQLFSKDIPIEDDLCEQIWNGKLTTFHFMLDLPEEYTKPTLGIRCRIYADETHITDLNIVAQITNQYQELQVEMRKILSAFASYSSKDRAIVAARLQGMLAATKDQMDIFFDVESLHTGEDWEERIRNEIKKRSIFYLFWSRNARVSDYVQKELDIALKEKDMQDIEPIPLESPDICPPPESLNRKHFFNRMLNYTNNPDMSATGKETNKG